MTRRFAHAEMVDEIGKMIWSKRTWLDEFSDGKSRRPPHEIETKQREMAVLEQAQADYRRAAERKHG